MLIAVDGFEASAHARVGVGRFEVDLLKVMYEIDTVNSYRVYVPSAVRPDLPGQEDRWRYRLCSFNRLWSQIALSTYLAIDRPLPDVFFAPVHYAPRVCPAPLVVGIMDLSFLRFPKLFRKCDLYKLVNWTAYSVKKAKKIIAISQSTKDDIIKLYGVEPSKVALVHPGVSVMTMTTTAPASDEVKKKYGIEGDYLLYVGTLQPRKNLVRLIEAFKSIKCQARLPAPERSDGGPVSSVKYKNKKLQLVIVGKKGWMCEVIFEKVKELNLEKEVVFTGYVPDEELPVLYKGAACFVLVSLYEGFGFPVLEAMSLGVPVVCSNISSLPEIVGDCGIVVNPESADAIARGIEKVLSMSNEEIKKLRNEGMKRASKFTWEKAAKQTLAILEEVGKRI